MKTILRLFKETAKGWMSAKAPRMGAALSYYTVFSITPLLVLVISLVGLLVGREAVQSEIFSHISALVGKEGSEALMGMISKAQKPSEGLWTSLMAGFVLLFGATGVFVQLQDALNSIWNVEQKPEKGWWRFLRKRFLSFAMILVVGFLLLVSLVLSAGISAAGKYLVGAYPSLEVAWQSLNIGISFGAVAVLFAFMFKFLPDVKLRWRDVWIGAMITSFLFVLGKFLLGLYLGRSSVVSGFGAAGGLVLVLLWVYYSAQIFFFGAEFTQQFVKHFHRMPEPEPHAERNPRHA